MRAVLISIRPEWCEKILNGEKIIEVRKSAPKPPFKVVVYCTKGKPNLYIPQEYNCFPMDEASQPYFAEEPILQECDNLANGKVIGEFICDTIEKFTMDYRQSDVNRRSKILKEACLSFEEATDYQNGSRLLYAWHISDLKIYDTPKELSEFNKKCKHFDKIECVGENYVCYACKYFRLSFYDGFPYCVKNGKIPITRPPQSWQYMEEEMK